MSRRRASKTGQMESGTLRPLPPLPPLPPPPQVYIWKPRFVVACGQMECSADLARNRALALAQIEEAARKYRARLIVLPETALSGYGPAHWPAGFAELDFKALRRAENDVQEAARKHKIGVVAGTTIRAAGRYFNSALLFGPGGKQLGRYDKLHLTGAANGTLDAAFFAPGNAKRLRPLRIAGVKVGVQICLDMRFPEPWRLLALAGARLFAHPTAAFGRSGLWKREAIEANLSSRASENGCWLASANGSGPFQYVSSRILDPDGRVAAAAPLDAEQVIHAAIDPDWEGRSGFLATRREDVYETKRKR